MTSKRLLILGIILIAGVSGTVLLAPYGEYSETILLLIAILSGMALLLMARFSSARTRQGGTSRAGGLWWIPVFLLWVILVYCPLTLRSFRGKIVGPDLHGEITKKYRSANHGYLAFELRLEDGRTETVEGLDDEVWNHGRVGDRFEKDAWCIYATIGGKGCRLLAPSPMDALRGLRVAPPATASRPNNP